MMASGVPSASILTQSITCCSVLVTMYGGATMSRSKPTSFACSASASIDLADVWVTWAAIGHSPFASSETKSYTRVRSSWVRLQNSPMPQVQPPPCVPSDRMWRTFPRSPSSSNSSSGVNGVMIVVHWPRRFSRAQSMASLFEYSATSYLL